MYGKEYAMDMFNGGGLEPVEARLFDLPKNLKPMKILECLNESSIEDIITQIINSNSSDDEKANEIFKKFSTYSDDGNKKKNEPETLKEPPQDEIFMRYGKIDPKDFMNDDNHIISQREGDEIRKNLKVSPKDPYWGLSGTESDIVETFPILNRILSSDPTLSDKEKEADDEFNKKIQGRIKGSREGIINWKDALQEFVSRSHKKYKKGSLRKLVYTNSGIGLRHRERDKNAYDKCVIYIDTSYSVNNHETRLIPVMIGEIGKIMTDCKFEFVDIHLFAGTVYDSHVDIDAYTVQDEEWGLEDVSDGGTTNISQVYRDIIARYTEDGELIPDVNAIIIITDDEGILQDGGNVKPFLGDLDESVFERMLYVIYRWKFTKDVLERNIDKVIHPSSQSAIISVEDFKKQIDGYNSNMKSNYKIDEGFGSLNKLKQKQAVLVNPDPGKPTVVDTVDKKEKMKKINIKAARLNGTLDRLLPDLIANINKFFPNIKQVKEYNGCFEHEYSYYITDDAHVILHMNIDSTNINSLCEACSVMTIDQLIGDVVLKSARTFKGFPVGFPKEIGGNLIMFDLAGLRSFDNAPHAVAGRASINVCYPMNRYISRDAQNKYVTSLRKTLTPIGELENKPKHVFTMTMRNNESVVDIIKNRIALSESYVNEMAMPKKLSPIFPRRSKPQAGSKTTEDDYITSTELYKKNRQVFFDVIDPILNVGWGDVDDKDVTVIDNENISKIREAAKDTTYYKKHKDDKSQSGFAGIRLFTTSDNIISAVYAQSGKEEDMKIIFLTDSDGNPITNYKDIVDEVEWRYNIINQTKNYLDSLGITPDNLVENFNIGIGSNQIRKKSNLYGASLWILYHILSMLNGSSNLKYKFDIKSILSDDFDFSSNEEIFNALMERIFGSDIRQKTSSSYQIDGRYSINLNQTNKDGKVQSNNAYLFNKTIQDACKIDIFEVFSDNFLKALLIGSSLRGVDDLPRYNEKDIINADRSSLIDMIDSCEDVLLSKTVLKCLSFDFELKEHINRFDVLLLFPDKCEAEYVIRVDVNKEALKLAGKKVLRDIYKSGMYNDIKNYDYDRATGERTRNDIKGTWSSKKIADQNDIFASFSGCIDYILANKVIFKDVKNSLKNAIDEYTNAYSWYSNKTLLSKIDDSVDILYNYSNLIKSKLINNEDLITKKQDVIEKMVETLNGVIDHIEFIINQENDYMAIVDEGEKLVKSAMTFGEEYKILAGESDEAANITAKKMKKLGDRNRSKKAANVSIPQDNGEDAKAEQTKTKFAQVIDDLSDNIVKVNAAMKKLDFAGASDNAVDLFETKDGMIRRISNQLNKVIEMANVINTNNSIDMMNRTSTLLNTVFSICREIINANNEEEMTDFAVELYSACIAFTKAAKGFAAQQTYKQTGTFTA